MELSKERGLALLSAALGSVVTAAEQPRVALADRLVFDAYDDADRHYIIKVDTDAQRHECELAGLRFAAPVIPAPQLITADDITLAYRYVEGSPLSQQDDAAPWEATGGLLTQLHAQPSNCPEEHCAHWGRFFLAGAHHEIALARHLGILTDNQAVHLETYFTRELRGLELDHCVALHGDCKAEHVLISPEGNVAALLDFADFGCGDPLLEIATVTAWHPQRLPQILAGYQPNPALQLRAQQFIEPYWARRHLGVARWQAQQKLPHQSPLMAALKFAGPYPS